MPFCLQWPDVAKEVEEEKRDFRFQILFLSNKLCVRHKKQLNLPTIALLPPAQDFFTELEEAFPPTYLDKVLANFMLALMARLCMFCCVCMGICVFKKRALD